MKKNFSFAFLFVLTVAVSASAEVSISSPGNGADVTSPFTLSAYSSNCSSQPVSIMGYSLDSSTDTTIIHDTSVDAKISAGNGSHTVHVKAWGDKGAVCVTDVKVNISGGASSSAVPSDATSVSSIQTLGDWKETHDGGTSGSGSGSMSLTGSPSRSGHARKFSTSFSGSAGERFYSTFGDDRTSTHFFYDAWLYLDSSASKIGNLEMDMNQTMPNGNTVILGFQCDGWSSTWDYTKNTGSPSHPKGAWVHTKAYCNPRAWARDKWHHVQVSYERNSSGVVTYEAVWLDGSEQKINATVPSAYSLGWGSSLLTNFQIDGVGSGSTHVYVDDLTVYRW